MFATSADASEGPQGVVTPDGHPGSRGGLKVRRQTHSCRSGQADEAPPQPSAGKQVSRGCGSQVLGRATLKVDGAFGGAGDGSVQLLIGSGLGGTLVRFESSLLVGFTSIDRTFELPNLAAGDVLTVSLVLRAGATAGASAYSAVKSSVADLGNAARLFVDLETPGASWEALSGHDYRLTAVPLPAGFWLFGSALLGVARLRRRASPPAPFPSLGALRASG